MRTQTVDIQSSYTYHKTNVLGASVLVSKYTGRGQLFKEDRPDRDKRKKPTGWLYPRSYFIDVKATRMNPNCSVKTGNTQLGYIDGKRTYFEEVHQYNGNFLMDVIFAGGYVPLLPFDSNERKKAEIAALLKLKEDRINLGNAFAEHRQTAKFVGDTFTAIARSFKYAKKANWKRAASELKKQYRRNRRADSPIIPRKWLEWQYAVKPLMEDVNGACFALSRDHPVSNWIMTSKGISKVEVSSVRKFHTGQWNSTTLVDELFRGYFVRLDFHPRNDFLQLVNSYGVVNPLVPLWEITPWSFVIDWALPIGEWFEAMDATFGLEFLSGSCTTLRKAKTVAHGNRDELRQNHHASGQWWVENNMSLYGTQRQLSLDRLPYDKAPIPFLPRYKNPVSATHVANGLSLLVATLTGGVPSRIKR